MSMDRSVAISLIIHLALIAPFFFFHQSHQSPRDVPMIDLLSFGDPNKEALRNRSRLRRKQPSQKSSKQGTSPKKESQNLLGNDPEAKAHPNNGGLDDPERLAVALYARDLERFIEKNRYFPRRALIMKHSGTVQMRLTISKAGQFTNVEILEGTPHSILNKAALKLVKSLKSFKALPSSYKGDGRFVIPIHYKIHDSH